MQIKCSIFYLLKIYIIFPFFFVLFYLQYDCYKCSSCCCRCHSCRACSCHHPPVDSHNNQTHILITEMTCSGNTCFELSALQQNQLAIKPNSVVTGIPTYHIWLHCNHVYTNIQSLLSSCSGRPKQSWRYKIGGLENKKCKKNIPMSTTAVISVKEKEADFFLLEGHGQAWQVRLTTFP